MVTASPEASQSPATQDSNAPLQDLGSSVSPIVWVIIGLIILGGAIGVLAKFMRNSK